MPKYRAKSQICLLFARFWRTKMPHSWQQIFKSLLFNNLKAASKLARPLNVEDWSLPI
jgi:hypothetical protein